MCPKAGGRTPQVQLQKYNVTQVITALLHIDRPSVRVPLPEGRASYRCSVSVQQVQLDALRHDKAVIARDPTLVSHVLKCDCSLPIGVWLGPKWQMHSWRLFGRQLLRPVCAQCWTADGRTQVLPSLGRKCGQLLFNL